MPVRYLTEEPFHVERHFVGAALASPVRRFLAFWIDVTLLAIPTVLASLLIAGAFLHVRDRAAFDAVWNLATGKVKGDADVRRTLRDLVPLLLELEPRGMPREAIAAAEEGHPEKAVEVLESYDFSATLSLEEHEDATPLPPKTIRVQLEKLIPGVARGIALFLVPAFYFTILTCGRRGATFGKRLLGIRVVRLDGEHLSWLEGLERFIGYLHIPGTFFIGLLDLWKDPNRRMAHDRVAHTAVIRTARHVVQQVEQVQRVQQVQQVQQVEQAQGVQ